jgi:hypothetical protein
MKRQFLESARRISRRAVWEIDGILTMASIGYRLRAFGEPEIREVVQFTENSKLKEQLQNIRESETRESHR